MRDVPIPRLREREMLDVPPKSMLRPAMRDRPLILAPNRVEVLSMRGTISIKLPIPAGLSGIQASWLRVRRRLRALRSISRTRE